MLINHNQKGTIKPLKYQLHFIDLQGNYKLIDKILNMFSGATSNALHAKGSIIHHHGNSNVLRNKNLTTRFIVVVYGIQIKKNFLSS